MQEEKIMMGYNECNASMNLDNFLGMVRAARELKTGNQLNTVLGMFKENFKYQYCKSTEIFQALFDDPTGAEYWRGWFAKPSLTVEAFTRLLATHTAVEYADKISKDAPPPMDKYYSSRKSIILTLRETAEMKCLPFIGELDALLGMKAGNIQLGVTWITNAKGVSKPKTLDQVRVYPLQTLQWFTDSPEHTELLPESLRLWWNTQTPMVSRVGGSKLKPQKQPPQTANEIEDHESFIRSLQVSYVNDTEIRIKSGNQRGKAFSYIDLGFKRENTKTLRTLLQILKLQDHLFHIGVAHGAGKVRNKAYDANRNILREISNKFCMFIKNTYNLQLPDNCQIFELLKNERPGTYGPKFTVSVLHAEDAYYGSYSRDELISEIEKLSERKAALEKRGDEDSENKLCQITDELNAAIKMAIEKKWIERHRAASYLNPPED